MNIQDLVSDLRSRANTFGKRYQDVINSYVSAQREAISVVTRNGQTLANTEIGAAKNVFAAARASFDKARADGVREIANNPQAYVPNGRDQIVSAYKDSIDLLVKTANELRGVVTEGYKTVLGQLDESEKPAAAKTAKSGSQAKQPARKTAAKRSTATAGNASSKTAKSSGNAKSSASAGKSQTAGAKSNTAKTTKTTKTASSQKATGQSQNA